ncbi:MAG: NAD(P)/FAD-dependent oxidoreductase [Chloroflexota bacterium]|nr:NAD(P)/FAD-dependent oxidoreductase [Chloroflexota bacterium]
MSGPPRVVILGGGFAGLHLVRWLERRLRRGEADVTLIDRNDYHLFTPLLYQVATGELPPHAVAYPLRRATAHARFSFVKTEAEAIDTEARLVRTADGPFAYEHLVLVPGSVTNDYGIPGVREYALPLKLLVDAERVRRRILDSFESAVVERDPVRRRELLTFAIIGAGPAGVETASSIRDLMDHSLRPMHRSIDFDRDVTIVLVDGSDRVIPQMDRRLSRLASKRLAQQKVQVMLRTMVTEVRPGSVRMKDGRELRAGTIVWAGGVRTHPLVAGLDGLAHARDGRVTVDRTFQAGGRGDVLAFGDAAYMEWRGTPLPQLAQVATLQAPIVAANIAHLIRGELLVPYEHKPKGDLIALGRTQAGANMLRLGPVPTGNIVFGGFPAWAAWRVNYLLQLLGVRNRATLLMEWTLSYFITRMVANTP